jgi:hypothetical protein
MQTYVGSRRQQRIILDYFPGKEYSELSSMDIGLKVMEVQNLPLISSINHFISASRLDKEKASKILYNLTVLSKKDEGLAKRFEDVKKI